MAYSAKPQVFDGRPSVRRTAEPSLPTTSLKRMDFQPTTKHADVAEIVKFVGDKLRSECGISVGKLLKDVKAKFPHNVTALEDVTAFVKRICAQDPKLAQRRRDAIKEHLAAKAETPPTALESQPSLVAPAEAGVDITHPLVEPPASSLAESPIDVPVERVEPKPVAAEVQQAAALFFSDEHIRYSPGKIIEINEVIYLMVPIHGTNKTFYLATEYECREALVALRKEYSRAISKTTGADGKDPAQVICDSIDSILRPTDELGFFSGVTSISSMGSLVRLVSLYLSDHKHKLNPGGIMGRPLPTSEIGMDSCINTTVRFMEKLGTTDIHLVSLQEQFRGACPSASLPLSLVAHIRDRASSKYIKLKDSSRGAADVVAPPQPKTLELNDEQFFELCVAYITEWLSSYALLDSTLQDDLERVFGRDQRSRIETMFPAALSVVCNTNPDIKNRRETRLLEEQRKEAKRREKAKQYYE